MFASLRNEASSTSSVDKNRAQNDVRRLRQANSGKIGKQYRFTLVLSLLLFFQAFICVSIFETNATRSRDISNSGSGLYIENDSLRRESTPLTSGFQKIFHLSHDLIISQSMPSCREKSMQHSTETNYGGNELREFNGGSSLEIKTHSGERKGGGERVSVDDEHRKFLLRGVLTTEVRSVEQKKCIERKKFPLENFSSMNEKGGLLDDDRVLLGEVYYNAESVFEFGLGESTKIAAYTNVPRYAGVDSNAEWVSSARGSAPYHYRFYFADVGSTRNWGYPVAPGLVKGILDYQVAPLWTERESFDVYLVDGRWRIGCVYTSFMHAIARGGNMEATLVLLHDYHRNNHPKYMYSVVENVADIVKRSTRLAVLKLKNGVSEEDLVRTWMEQYKSVH